MKNSAQILNEVLKGHSIKANCNNFSSFDNFDIFDIELQKGCKISHLENISRELQLHLKLKTIPIFIPDNNSGLLQMIYPKRTDQKLLLKDIIKEKNKIKDTTCQIGLDVLGSVVDIDLTKAPHLLVVGTTGSGKSVFLNVLIGNIFNMGFGASLYLVDPKRVEFSIYDDMFLTNIKEKRYSIWGAISVLEEMKKIMNYRYNRLAEMGCTNIKQLPKNCLFETIFVIIDEIADLISNDEGGRFTKMLCELASKSRAAGIHFIIATQRASASIIDGRIKANFPTRVVFKVASGIESRIVIDSNGAENLASYGDGILYGYDGGDIKRFKSAYIDQKEAMTYTSTMKKHLKKYGGDIMR